MLLMSTCIVSGCQQEQIAKEEYMYFLFATPLEDHQTWQKAKQGFLKACDVYHLKCDWKGPIGINTEQMEEVIRVGIAQRASAIITQGVVDEALLDEAQKENIPVMLVDSDMPNSSRFAYIGKNFNEQAKMILQDVEKAYGKEKKLYVAIQVAELDFAIAQQQIEEVEAVFSTHPGGYEIVSITQSKSDNVYAKQQWDAVMAEENTINVALNFAGESAAPCYEAAQKYDRRDEMLIYGVDEIDEIIDLVRDGSINGSIVVSFYDYGYESVKLLYDYVKNGQQPQAKENDAKLILVTKDNVDTYSEELTR